MMNKREQGTVSLILSGRKTFMGLSAFRAVALFCLICAGFSLCGCQSQTPHDAGGSNAGTSPSGGSYAMSDPVRICFDEGESQSGNGCYIDTAHVEDGYVVASATSSRRLKFQVLNGASGYNYDIPNDGTATCYSLNMGNGAYAFRIMQNIEESSYIELFSTSANVVLSSEFAPFLCPAVYCWFTEDSLCVKKARELAMGANTDYEAADAIYQWVISNVSYDKQKAVKLTNATGYYPDPDETFSSKKGICLDYTSLVAAMMRGVGIPTKIITGYVSGDEIYHAWNMVYLSGEWVSISFNADGETWSRVDSTFAASGESPLIGDGQGYVDKYVY